VTETTAEQIAEDSTRHAVKQITANAARIAKGEDESSRRRIGNAVLSVIEEMEMSETDRSRAVRALAEALGI
jgi:hypothetical protein